MKLVEPSGSISFSPCFFYGMLYIYIIVNVLLNKFFAVGHLKVETSIKPVSFSLFSEPSYMMQASLCLTYSWKILLPYLYTCRSHIPITLFCEDLRGQRTKYTFKVLAWFNFRQWVLRQLHNRYMFSWLHVFIYFFLAKKVQHAVKGIKYTARCIKLSFVSE